MNIVRICLAWGLSFFLTQGCMAGIDPVTWSLVPASGFLPVPVGGMSSVVYTLSNTLPIPIMLNTSFVKNSNQFFIQDHCNGFSFLPSTSCSIVINFLPQTAGQASIQLTYSYHKNRIPLPLLMATSQ